MVIIWVYIRSESPVMNTRALVLTASLMALNLTLGKIAATLSLPVYLDTIGTIIAATMLPWRYAVATGVGTSLLAGLVIHPAYPFYAGNQFIIASLVSSKLGGKQVLQASFLPL